MRFLLAAGFLSLVASPVSVLAGCPYAAKHAAARSVPEPASRRQTTRGSGSNSKCAAAASSSASASTTKGIFYMNRIAPGNSELYIANADGSNATLLLGNQSDPFDFHASWSPDGQWITFTSERRADGQADLYRVRPDGTQLETLVQTDYIDDVGVLSPDGTKLAYVSTQGNHTANIWVKDLTTGVALNVTDTASTRTSNRVGPQGHFRPSWSPDGEWVAFSSDRDTDWTGHSNGTGWEHTQTLGLYIVRPNGTDLRLVAKQSEYAFGTPKWSPDGTRLLYNVISSEDTYAAHSSSSQQEAVSGQIWSVDIATGANESLTSGDYLKVSQQYIGNSTLNVGYVVKGSPSEGINYTRPDATHQPFNMSYLRNPSWSPDGSRIVYEVLSWDVRAAGRELFSFDSDWDYRFMDVFPTFNNATRRIAITQKQLGNSSVVTSSPTYTDLRDALDSYDIWSADNATEETYILSGLGGAFQPTWSPDGAQIAVGYGTWFFDRSANPATIYLANASVDNSHGGEGYDAAGYVNLTQIGGTLNAGFPSFSPDGSKLVYRLWDYANAAPLGLRILDLATGATTVLTEGWDNTPGWSPDGERIVFTRQVNWTASYGSRWYADRFDIMTIRPDGSELTQVTDSPANDAHAVWSYDGRIMWSSGMYGFRDESALYDDTFQPYGQIMVMNYDGSDKTLVTDTLWEDSMPMYLPNEFL